MPVTLEINGKRQTLDLDPRVTLLDALREHLHLTGTKKGCDHGQCGACTGIVEGRRQLCCLRSLTRKTRQLERHPNRRGCRSGWR